MPRAFFTQLLPVRQGPARVTPTLESLHQSPSEKGLPLDFSDPLYDPQY